MAQVDDGYNWGQGAREEDYERLVNRIPVNSSAKTLAIRILEESLAERIHSFPESPIRVLDLGFFGIEELNTMKFALAHLLGDTGIITGVEKDENAIREVIAAIEQDTSEFENIELARVHKSGKFELDTGLPLYHAAIEFFVLVNISTLLELNIYFAEIASRLDKDGIYVALRTNPAIFLQNEKTLEFMDYGHRTYSSKPLDEIPKEGVEIHAELRKSFDDGSTTTLEFPNYIYSDVTVKSSLVEAGFATVDLIPLSTHSEVLEQFPVELNQLKGIIKNLEDKLDDKIRWKDEWGKVPLFQLIVARK